jgi:beta-phosphoglucomutase-like phosphatase (HAD superfamily)
MAAPGESFPGSNLFDIIAGIKRRYSLPESVDELVAERRAAYINILLQCTTGPCDGVEEMFKFLDGQRDHSHVRFAYCSSSERSFTDIIFRKLFELIGMPEYVQEPDTFFFTHFGVGASTCWTSGLEKKPHPMLYELTCRKLNLQPSQCIAFEDSVSGGQAALKAGMNLVIVPNEKSAGDFSHLDLNTLYQQRMVKVASLRDFLALLQAEAEPAVALAGTPFGVADSTDPGISDDGRGGLKQ